MAGKAGQQLFVGVLGGGGVLVHPQDAGLGEEGPQLFLRLLGAEAPVLQLAPAGGADGGPGLDLGAAVVAQQPPAAVLVVDHGDAALGAFEHLAAVLALGHGLVAPAVQKQDGLFFGGQVFPDGVFQGQADLPGVAGGQLGPHIHNLDRRQRLAGVALGQPHQLHPPRPGLIKGLGAGGGGGQQQQRTVFGGPPPGHLLGGIPGGRFRPVGVLLLLVDDDQPDGVQRRKHRAAGAHHNVGPAVLDHLPLEQPLGVVEGRVLHRHPPAEPLFQAADHLGGEADFGHQHQGLFAQGQAPLDQLEEHQGFAAAGDPVEQGPVGLACLQVGGQGVVGGLLLGGEGQLLGLAGNVGVEVQGFVHLFAGQHPFGAEVFGHRPADAVGFQVGLGPRPAPQQGHRRQLFGGGFRLLGQGRRQPVKGLGVAGQLLLEHRGDPVGGQGRLVLGPVGNHRLDRLVPGAEGAGLQKPHQVQQLGGEAGRGRGHVIQNLQLGALGLGVAGQHHPHPGAAALAEWHQHHAPQPDLVLLVGHHPIGIQFIKVEGGMAHRDAHRLWHGTRSFLCWFIPAGRPGLP